MDAISEGTWFEAAWGGGSVWLCVGSAGRAAAHAVEAAMLLHRVEALLSPLDDWSGAGLDWRWVDAPTQGGQGMQASARWRGDSPAHECVVSWPWAVLRCLPAPPPELAARLEWSMVDAVLVLAELQIDPVELELLEPGGAVLVPQALQPPWQGLLRGAEAGTQASVAVDLSVPWRPRLAAPETLPAAVSTDPACTACELRLDMPLGVSAQRLAGWRREGDAGDIVQLSPSALRAALWRRSSHGHAEHALAAGRLMPWGDGWALAVETVEGA